MGNKWYVLLAGILFLTGCSEELVLENESLPIAKQSAEYTAGVVYPLVDEPISRSAVLESDWETIDKVTLSSGITVVTPWANYASGDIPVDVMRDIKKEDGWELIAHTMTSNNDQGQNYLIFHNYTTGILKVFYYLENYQTNNMGIWRLQFDGGKQKYLNFADQVADPVCYDSGRTSIDVTNLTEKTSKGFSTGWNCFQVELAYDPSPLCSSLRISAVTYNVQNINLGGEYDSATNGMLISKSSSNPFSSMVNGVANLTGKSAEKWYNNKFGKNLTENNSRVAVAGIVAAGAKLLLNSLVSRFNKETTTTQDIQLKTHGTINLNGSLVMENPSPIKSITLKTNSLGALGAWNLETWPVTYVYHHASLHHIEGENYFYKVRNSYNYCSVIMNPKLENKIMNSNTNCELIEYSKGAPACKYNDYNFDRGVLGKSMQQYGSIDTEILYDGDDVKLAYVKSFTSSYINIKMDKYIPSLGGIPQECDMNRYEISSGYGSFSRFMRVAIDNEIAVGNKSNVITSVKTFLPKYEWY